MTDRIRAMTPADAEGLAGLMHVAIHEGAAGAYTPSQLAAWSPEPRRAGEFLERVADQTVLVAEDGCGLAGFFTLTSTGVLDLAFVRPDRKGGGLAARLHDAILAAARDQGLSALTVDASHLARRFLEKRGWRLVETRTVERRGVTLKNHRMRRNL